MTQPTAEVCSTLVEYAEALTALIGRLAPQFPLDARAELTQPLEHYVALVTRQLQLDASAPADFSRAAVTAAWHALQHIGFHLERAARARYLSRTHYVLLMQLHIATLEALATLLNGHGVLISVPHPFHLKKEMPS